MSALDIRGLCAGYGQTRVLHDLDLSVSEGSVTAVLGSSGSGKTTLLRVIAGFERATSGTVSVAGQIVEGAGRRSPPERRGLGYVAQDGALFPHLTVARNVAFGLRRGPARAARVAELLELVGLHDLTGRYPHELSGGQQQRVALARAMAATPPVILLDEPFAALDAALRADVRNDITRILRSTGTTTVLVTHDQDEALSLADQVAVLRAGRITQTGSPSELYSRPQDAELARFLGDANLLAGVADGGGYRTALGHLAGYPVTALADGAVLVLVRPEQITVLPAHVGSGPSATVTSVEYHGHEVVLALCAHLPDGDVPMRARARPQLDLDVGADVVIRADGPVHAWSAS